MPTPDPPKASLGSAPRAKWLGWADLQTLTKSEAAADIAVFCDRLLQASIDAGSVADLLRERLPEIATEFSVQWAAIVQRSPEWQAAAEFGRRALSDLPVRLLEEALDREKAVSVALEEPQGWSLIAVPLAPYDNKQPLLVLTGRNLAEEALASAVAVGRALSIIVRLAASNERTSQRIQRLRSILDVASTFSRTRETVPLLESIAEQATRLLDCDRASIFIWDRERKEVVACPALGMEGGILRLPDNVGIVGEVIKTGKASRVENAYDDPRFNRHVDQSSGYVTNSLLCHPLLDGEGKLIGAFEMINKRGGVFHPDDEETLAHLCTQAAIAIQNTRELEDLVRSHFHLTEQVTEGVRIIGNSPAIVALRETIRRLAATDLPVLILGESGTGKEVVSQALHYRGPRAERPFVAVNCAALTESLLESELFGHEKGAFTDAREARAGKFELADGGTLFLDEIGDMSLGGQSKLLRVLEQKVVTRVGGSQTIPINVRVIAATNADLAAKVREKKFREDLYYRLSVVTQTLPPLRERPEDILPLAEDFLERFSRQARRPALKLTADARRRLQAHAWPGNVRELRNLMERIAFLNPTDRVEADDLAFILSPDRETLIEPSGDLSLDNATKKFQRDFIRRSVKRVQGNMSEAARLLGVHRSNLYRKMRQLTMKEVGGED